MLYYTKKKKKKKIKPWLIFLILFLFLINMFIIFFDKRVMPTVLELAKATMKNKIVRIINEISIEAYDELFKNDEVLDIKKDKDGNINMMNANTMKLNKLNGIISTRANEAIQEMGTEGLKVPLGWVTDSSIYYEFGPDITVNVDPIGNVATKFNSSFESAGINQTRYTIYLQVEARVNVQIPLYMEEVVVNAEVPLAETIVVGKIPNTAVDFGQFGSNDFESGD
ncbi:MAG: sporulation protein YunB [Clostridium sp.]|uniref:sporulation protein YunB n=1 Tax=Clostridium sp. TaxID=1506 RepID=UPI003EE4E11B